MVSKGDARRNEMFRLLLCVRKVRNNVTYTMFVACVTYVPK